MYRFGLALVRAFAPRPYNSAASYCCCQSLCKGAADLPAHLNTSLIRTKSWLRRGQLQVPQPAEGEDASDEAAAWRKEVAIVERVISHLIAKDGVLVVVDTPQVSMRTSSCSTDVMHTRCDTVI